MTTQTAPTPIIERCADDGSDAELGATWVVQSAPLAGPLGMRTELHGLVGERLDCPECESFYWEAWHDCRIIGDELCDSGYTRTFNEAVAAIVALWSQSPLADAKPYKP